MRPPNPLPPRFPGLPEPLAALAPLLAAEAAAEAGPGGVEAADLEQAVWVRLLVRGVPPRDPAGWVRAAVRAEMRPARRRARREVPWDAVGGRVPAAPGACAVSAEQEALTAERGRALRAAARRLPGRCPALIAALMSRSDPTYREISQELGISQGSLGPLRSRCLACLRAMLRSEVEAPQLRGKER